MDRKESEMTEKGISSSTSGVVVQVREKKGPLRAAIPYMPFPVAVLCLFLNTFVPGLGTFVSAFTVLCGARTDLPERHMCCVFWLNIAAALIQILTAIVMVGWIMSIFWGMDMVILATPHRLQRTRDSTATVGTRARMKKTELQLLKRLVKQTNIGIFFFLKSIYFFA
uniref:Stum, mechanosensory transduction mediator homolog n=1 Tax=Latimeria chalumnae TaxID=7897 RepID=H3AE98_LATCH